jgi:H/ACA ribonucleoprotein complex subunit 3
MPELRKCGKCSSYMISQACPACGHEKTVSPRPPKYSVEDRYAKYRRMAKEQQPK